MNPTLREIKLHGSLKDLYSGQIILDCKTTAEMIRGLSAQIKGFDKALREGYFRIVRGDNIDTDQFDVDETLVNFRLGRHKVVHIIPVPAGAKKGGFGKIVLGIALVGLSFAVGPATLAGFAGAPGAAAGVATAGELSVASAVLSGASSLGFSMILGGISQMLTPQVKNNYQTGSVDERASFLFDGATNVSEQGGPINLCYGQFLVGSTIIAAGLDVEKI